MICDYNSQSTVLTNNPSVEYALTVMLSIIYSDIGVKPNGH